MTSDLTTAAPDLRPDALSPRRRWPLVVTVLLLTFALRLPAFFVDVFNSDETFLATQAQVIRDGGSLYQEATDRKPPLVPYLYAATFAVVGSSALWSVRVVAMLAVAFTALLLASEARRRWGESAGWIAALLFVGASVAFAPQDGQAANFEVFMLPAMTAAVVLAARDRPRGAGFAVAVATLAKQTGAATLLPVGYLLWKRRSPGGVRRGLLAFALPLLIAALLVGPGDLVFWAVAGNGSYFGLGSVSAYVAGLFAVMTFAFIACNLPILWTVPTAWRHRAGDRHRPLDLVAVRRVVGRGRVSILRALLPATAPASVPDQCRRPGEAARRVGSPHRCGIARDCLWVRGSRLPVPAVG